MEPLVHKKLFFWLSMEIFNKVLIFNDKYVPFFSISHKEEFNKGPHKLKLFKDELRRVNLVQGGCNNIK
jgi:hypothetical protein